MACVREVDEITAKLLKLGIGDQFPFAGAVDRPRTLDYLSVRRRCRSQI